MGENKHIEELDKFAKKYLKEIPTETPSAAFTANIMNTILAIEKKAVYQNNSKLSNSIWFVLGGFIVASMYLLINGESSKIEIPDFGLNKIQISNIHFSHLFDTISVSTTTMYAFFFLALLFAIQVWFVKDFNEKRLP